ncbi:MAG: hypothetical protein ABID87_07910 [Chloroflexota bacterium]
MTMKYVLGFLLTVGGVLGITVSLLGDTVVTSNLYALNGVELSVAIGSFSLVAVLGGIYTFVAG